MLDVRHPRCAAPWAVLCWVCGGVLARVLYRVLDSVLYWVCGGLRCWGCSGVLCWVGDGCWVGVGCWVVYCGVCRWKKGGSARLVKKFAPICSAKPHQVEHPCQVERAHQQCNATAGLAAGGVSLI